MVSDVGYTSFDVLLSMNEPGTLFYAVTIDQQPIPTITEIIDQDPNDTVGRRLARKVPEW